MNGKIGDVDLSKTKTLNLKYEIMNSILDNCPKACFLSAFS